MSENEIRHVMGLSGGKDSSALAVYVQQEMPDIAEQMEYFFCDTHKELPETYEYLERLEARLGIACRNVEYLFEDSQFYYYKVTRWYNTPTYPSEPATEPEPTESTEPTEPSEPETDRVTVHQFLDASGQSGPYTALRSIAKGCPGSAPRRASSWRRFPATD